MPKVTKEKFALVTRELAENGDFFDPVMLDEFTRENTERPRPTTMKEVNEDFMTGQFADGSVTAEELYEVINFLESYSDVDLYAVYGSGDARARRPHKTSNWEPLASLINDWYAMYSDEFDLWQRNPEHFLYDIRYTGEVVPAETLETKFVVVDPDSGDIVGPFDSKEQAKAYFITMATKEEWRDVLELIDKTGKPFTEIGDPFVFTEGRSEQLMLRELSQPVRIY